MGFVSFFGRSTSIFALKKYLHLLNSLSLKRLSIMTSNQTFTVAVCQLNSTADRKKNFETCKDLITNAVSRQAKMVFLPECFDHIGESRNQSIELSETLDGPLITEYRQLAAQKSVWLSLGGFHEKTMDQNDGRVYNSHIIINSDGEIVSVYRKIHMFDIDIAGRMRLKESDYTIPGKNVNFPVDTPVGKIGMGICYDLRFPEFALSLTKAGAEILTYPSTFTQITGMAHWEPLLRSRAIECQSYVIAAAQTGKHNAKRVSYGHAMVVDPWGCVVACCSEGEGVAFANIDLELVRKIRTEMPVWEHRRSDLYGNVSEPAKHDFSTYMFGPHKLHPDVVFYKSRYSMAFVNRKPVVPGHVLVTPFRCVERLAYLNPSEVSDLFLCVQKVQAIIEKQYDAKSSCIAIQDGTDAGQTVPHVHVHILPRKPGDFERNDDVYVELQKHDKTEENFRSEEDMIEEAQRLKKLF